MEKEFANLQETQHNALPTDNDNENTTPVENTNQENSYNEEVNLITPENEIVIDPFLLSSYSTKILTNDSNRYNNIKIVSDKLNGYLLGAGQTFSYNEVCGPYGESDGFLEAPVLLSDGTETKGFGGGVCQLSSTLYNAIKTLDVDITERHHHSAPVAYVPKDEDATVSMQSDLDFKFINNTGKTLRFDTAYDPDNLTVKVYEQ
ncbi:MAG: VanW family protein [Clostridia bacterium]|nr:VanW family protein [Clostridia bacterium]